MKRLLPLLLFAIAAFPCGTERWAVKTLADEDATTVAMTPVSSTVAELNSFAAPTRADLDAKPASRFPEELKTYKVTGILVGFKREADEDFHVVLRDLATTDTMVVEFPASECVQAREQEQTGSLQEAFAQRFGKPSAKFRNVEKHKMKIEVVGVGFFDFIHGQTGVAKNGFELHPVLSWREVQ